MTDGDDASPGDAGPGDFIPNDDFSRERPWRDIPLTIRRRMDWSDADAAQIGYTSRHMDIGLAAIENWWEQVLGLNWFDLRKRDMGSPSVDARVEFYRPMVPGERVNSAVFVERIGTSSWTFRADGHNDDGTKCFSVWQTAVLVEGVGAGKPKSTPIPDHWRRRAEGYRRECELVATGVCGRREVLDFWFGAPGDPERGVYRDVWFASGDDEKRAAFDAEMTERFTATVAAAARGDLDHWDETPAGALALILLLDQFPRNIHRGSARAFAGDEEALALAAAAIGRGFDHEAHFNVRIFYYMPYQHTEDLDQQRRSLEVFAGLTDHPRGANTLEYAQLHHDIIERFGRFPHRNLTLGRSSTLEEEEFLEDPKMSFGQG